MSDPIDKSPATVTVEVPVPRPPPRPSLVVIPSTTAATPSANIPSTRETEPTVKIKEEPPIVKSLPPAALGHRKRHSRGHSVTKIEVPVEVKDDPPPPTSVSGNIDKQIPVENPGKLASASFVNVNSDDIAESSVLVSRPQSAGGRLDLSGNTRSQTEHSSLATVVATAKDNNVVKESTPRKISAPPLHLLNLFEPLPSAVSPPKLTIDTTPQQRPMSMIVSSHSELSNSLTSNTSSLAASATVSSSLSSIGLLKEPGSSSALSCKNDTLNEQDEDERSELEEESDKQIEPPEVPLELDIRKEEIKEETIKEETCEKKDMQDGESPKQDSTAGRSHNTSLSSEGSENIGIVRVPSHPDLRLRPQLVKGDSLDSSPIMRARSVSQLQSEIDVEGGSFKRRAYSGSRETVPGFAGGLLKENSQMRRSYDRLRTKGTYSATPSRLPLSHQNSPNKAEKERLSRRTSADPDRDRERVLSAGSKGRSRPKSMIETGSYVHHRNPSMDFALSASQDFLVQLFWTSVSLLESDYENEYYLAQHLFGKVISQLDLKADSTYTRLEMILQKTKPEKFTGVQKLLLKGVTLGSTTKSTRELLSSICPHVNRSIFDPSCFKGLPLNVVALLPELVLCFEKPSESARSMAGTISKVR